MTSVIQTYIRDLRSSVRGLRFQAYDDLAEREGLTEQLTALLEDFRAHIRKYGDNSAREVALGDISYSIRGLWKPVWDDPENRQELVAELLRDIDSLEATLKGVGE